MNESFIPTAVEWQFRCETLNRETRWHWRQRVRGGAVLATSRADFPSLLAAIEDAKKNGFRYDAGGTL